nr:hypothetical protein [Pectinatus sottacetonis]
MMPLEIVGVDIILNGLASLLDVVILCQIGFFILEASEPTFNHDIVSPSTFAIHVLPYLILPEKIGLNIASKLAMFKISGFATSKAFLSALMTILVSQVYLYPS